MSKHLKRSMVNFKKSHNVLYHFKERKFHMFSAKFQPSVCINIKSYHQFKMTFENVKLANCSKCARNRVHLISGWKTCTIHHCYWWKHYSSTSCPYIFLSFPGYNPLKSRGGFSHFTWPGYTCFVMTMPHLSTEEWSKTIGHIKAGSE